jgi:hypothetical protein
MQIKKSGAFHLIVAKEFYVHFVFIIVLNYCHKIGTPQTHTHTHTHIYIYIYIYYIRKRHFQPVTSIQTKCYAHLSFPHTTARPAHIIPLDSINLCTVKT